MTSRQVRPLQVPSDQGPPAAALAERRPRRAVDQSQRRVLRPRRRHAGNVNERVARDHAHVPNVRNWALRDYGNRVGVWRLMEVMTRYGMRGTAALNSEVCNHHPEVVAEMVRLGWELMGHNETNALRLTEMKPEAERASILAALDTIERASGTRPVGWLGAGLAETWHTLDYLAEGGVRYVCDWVNDDQPYTMDVGAPPLVSLPYSVQINDVPAYFDFKQSVPEFEQMIRRQFDVLYREGAEFGPRHGDRGASVRHRPAASYRRPGAGARVYLQPRRRVAGDRLGDRPALSSLRLREVALRPQPVAHGEGARGGLRASSLRADVFYFA